MADVCTQFVMIAETVWLLQGKQTHKQTDRQTDTEWHTQPTNIIAEIRRIPAINEVLKLTQICCERDFGIQI